MKRSLNRTVRGGRKSEEYGVSERSTVSNTGEKTFKYPLDLMTRKLSMPKGEQLLVELTGKNEWESRKCAWQMWTTEIMIKRDGE